MTNFLKKNLLSPNFWTVLHIFLLSPSSWMNLFTDLVTIILMLLWWLHVCAIVKEVHYTSYMPNKALNTLVRFSVVRAHSGSRRSLWDVQSVADEAGAGVVWEPNPADAAQRHTSSGPRPAAQLRVPARHEEFSWPSPGSLALWWGTWHSHRRLASLAHVLSQISVLELMCQRLGLACV